MHTLPSVSFVAAVVGALALPAATASRASATAYVASSSYGPILFGGRWLITRGNSRLVR